jgi:hypothetical protein
VGCVQVKEVREKKEAGKSRARFWEVAGSKMGKVTGVRCVDCSVQLQCYAALGASACIDHQTNWTSSAHHPLISLARNCSRASVELTCRAD